MRKGRRLSSTPLWRDVRVLRIVTQLLFIMGLAAGIWWLMNNLTTNLEQSGLNIGFRFLKDTAGFPISEGIAYNPTNVNGYAFLVGIVNTIRVAIIGMKPKIYLQIGNGMFMTDKCSAAAPSSPTRSVRGGSMTA